MRDLARGIRPGSTGYLRLNAAFQASYEPTMRAVLDRTHQIAGRSLSLRETDIAVAYGVRNAMAHGIRSEPVIAERFDEIERHLFFLVFSALECLY